MTVISKSAATAYATKPNIVVPHAAGGGAPGGEAFLESTLDADLTAYLDNAGVYEDGRIITDEEADATEQTATVLTTQSGSADQDENQIVILPDNVEGTFVLTIPHSGDGGTPDAVAAVDLDASAATLQAAIDAVTGTANEIVVTKATGRRVFGLTWSHANEDLTNHAESTVAVTSSGTHRGAELTTASA